MDPSFSSVVEILVLEGLLDKLFEVHGPAAMPGPR